MLILYYHQSIKETLRQCNTSLQSGLTSKEAGARLIQYRANEMEKAKHKSFFIRVLEQWKDFMILVLLAAAIVSFGVSYAKGDTDWVDPIIIFIIILVNSILGAVQECKAEKSIEALQNMSAPKAHVLRNGKREEIDAKRLVPGDIIFLDTGSFVPADGRLLESHNLKVEESALTGESESVEKNADVILPKDTPLSDRKNCVLATSFVTAGRGTAVVTHTGMQTQVGHIAKMMMEDESPKTPLQRRLNKLGKALGTGCLLICFAVFVMGILQNRPFLEMFMTSVSLAVAAIPEGLPAIVTIMLSLGVQRLSAKKAIIRKLPVVEALGSATVICSDKTGTLTQNKMTVLEVTGEERDVLEKAFACTNVSVKENQTKQKRTLSGLFSRERITPNPYEISGEPTEAAIAKAYLQQQNSSVKGGGNRIYEIPFDSKRKQMTVVMERDHQIYSVTKGAPDIILGKCTYYKQQGQIHKLTGAKRRELLSKNQAMADQAMRVLAVCMKQGEEIKKSCTPEGEKKLEEDLIFLGFLGLMDPPRPEAKQAVKLCQEAGIKPVMITGDHLSTAKAIAGQIGILGEKEKGMEGKTLDSLSQSELEKSIYDYSVFARVTPEHKVRIVKAFQERGEVVAMTGDGVNDAPALKAADIGCAMGKGGTDVAKNAGDMILADDNFATIVTAVEEGRGIFDNIKKAVYFLLSCNIGEILTIFLAVLFDMPSPLLAVQLLWVNLVTDSFPAIALGVEPAQEDVMQRKPIPRSEGIFNKSTFLAICLEGALIGSLALIAFFLGGSMGGLTTGRTMAFLVLSLSQLVHAFNLRSEHSLFHIGVFTNQKLCFSFVLCVMLQIVVVTIPALAEVFKVCALTVPQWEMVCILSLMPLVLVEIQKWLNRKSKAGTNS